MKALTALLLSATVFTAAPALAAEERAGGGENNPQGREPPKAPGRGVTFGATWCGPCRKEMPAMSAWYKAQKKGSVDMVGIALDTTDNIGKFLKQTPVSYPIWRYTGANSRNFMKAHGNNVGVLPFTVVEAPKCGYKQTITGEVNEKSLTAAVNLAKTKCK